MRGKLIAWTCSCLRGGITPADAGKTARAGRLRLLLQDHPRGCGENFANHNFLPPKTGSPPRMRGKPTGETYSAYLDRITPAHAGKTPAAHAQGRVSPDHPRACGEN